MLVDRMCLKRELDDIRVNVGDLCKELHFFKKEVISDALETNKEYMV